jgi:hypothetical protein
MERASSNPIQMTGRSPRLCALISLQERRDGHGPSAKQSQHQRMCQNDLRAVLQPATQTVSFPIGQA